MAARDGTLKAREFVAFCEDHALAMDPELPIPQRKIMWTMLQLHFGTPTVHFEVQPHVGRGIIELGLHFEGTAEANDAWAAMISERAADLLVEFGPSWELEVWTASWRRLHRTWRFEKLTAALGREVGEELGKALRVLGPIVRDEAPEGIESAAPPRAAAPNRRHGRRYAKRQA